MVKRRYGGIYGIRKAPMGLRKRVRIGGGARYARASRLGRLARFIPYVRPLTYAASAYGALRTARRFYRGRMKARQAIGHRIGFQRAKQVELSSALTAVAGKTLYSTPLISINKGSQNHQRERDIANISGFKICFYFINQNPNKAWLNVAVLVPKELTVGVNNAGFWRDSETNSREKDFSSAEDFLAINCNSINPDKYNILLKKKYSIKTDNGNSSNEFLTHYWVPLRRQLPFDSGTTIPKGHQVYLVWWVTTADNTGGTVGQRAYKTVTYFRDPKP